jgi:hypothetical protein
VNRGAGKNQRKQTDGAREKTAPEKGKKTEKKI